MENNVNLIVLLARVLLLISIALILTIACLVIDEKRERKKNQEIINKLINKPLSFEGEKFIIDKDLNTWKEY